MRIRDKAIELGFDVSDEPIQSGDTYLAMRNTGPHLLTCFKIKDGYIMAIENAYSYDLHECIKVTLP